MKKYAHKLSIANDPIKRDKEALMVALALSMV
jgi:hypothetical protein